MKKHKKIALGMSGGVDSSLCAHLLTEQGYDVTGVYMECWRAPGCRTEEDRKDALKVALSLDIPFTVLDFKNTYKQKVVDYFLEEYKAGYTPNPDVMCNKEVKFGLFYEWALQEGFDAIATGHYATIVESADGPHLAIPADTHKDQSYFLYTITQDQLNNTIFPLAELKKEEVRAEAEKRSIHVSDKKDSVGICFMGDINVHNFLEERLGKNPGEVVTTDGTGIGNHDGLWFYTVGQRHGFTIDATTDIKLEDGTIVQRTNMPPFYVIEKRPRTNQLVVGFGAETQRDDVQLTGLHFISSAYKTMLKKNPNILLRIRHTGELLPGTISLAEDKNSASIQLKSPTKGVAEGQSGVLYMPQDSSILCLGGGVINFQHN